MFSNLNYMLREIVKFKLSTFEQLPMFFKCSIINSHCSTLHKVDDITSLRVRVPSTAFELRPCTSFEKKGLTVVILQERDKFSAIFYNVSIYFE